MLELEDWAITKDSLYIGSALITLVKYIVVKNITIIDSISVTANFCNLVLQL